MGWIWTLVIGGLAGFIASKVVKGSGSGLIVNIILGILGSWFGGWIFSLLGITVSGVKWPFFLSSLVGAILILFIAGLLFKKKR